MADMVPQTPSLPKVNLPDVARLVKSLYLALTRHAFRLNLALPKDGTEAMAKPLPLLQATVAELGSTYAASDWTGCVVYVSDETGGATLAFSDGTNWRRAQDRVIVS